MSLLSDGGASKDTASTVSVVKRSVHGEVDVTVLTPGGTPRVLDGPGTSAFIITSQQDGVIKKGTASRRDDTTAVELPSSLVSFDGNGDGGLGNSVLELLDAGLLDALVSSVDLEGEGLSVLAGALDGLVGINLTGFNTVGGGVVQSEVRPASGASVAVGGTINDLLFREGEQDSGLEEVVTFEDTGGGEGPA